jgi:sugar O-acyltransferase (sialic acid O-acetyltransferase NeuD family)
MTANKVILIGYSGHALVVCDVLLTQKKQILGYCENMEKEFNPYCLEYLGSEKLNENILRIRNNSFFTAIGDNNIRRQVTQYISSKTFCLPVNAIHKNASISSTASLGNGIMIGDGSIINSCGKIGDGVICNTQSVIEHECMIGDYTHIAPGAVLCGNVSVGKNSFIGSRAVVKQGVNIGDNVIIGAGSVIIKNIPNNSKVVGNPQKFI